MFHSKIYAGVSIFITITYLEKEYLCNFLSSYKYYVTRAMKQNTNTKSGFKSLYYYMINYALFTKHTETNSMGLIILTWWAHYIFKDNTFIQHHESRLAFNPTRERTGVVSGHDCPARFYELLHSEDEGEQVTATSVFFCNFWREVSVANKGCSSSKFWYNLATSKTKIWILLYFFQNHLLYLPFVLVFSNSVYSTAF